MPNFFDKWAVCDCVPCFPRYFYTSDGLGAHTLTVAGIVSAGNQSLFWQGTATASLDTYTLSGISTTCIHQGFLSQTITYKLSYFCTYTSDSGGPRWQFTVSFPAVFCPDLGQLKYGSDGSSPPKTVTGTIAFTCDPDLIVINVPSTYTDVLGHSIAVPGGGGTFSFTR